MKKLTLFAVLLACVLAVGIGTAQYTNPSNPNYGTNKPGQCYNSTLNNWVNIANTTANLNAYPITCDQQGNLTIPTGTFLPLTGGTLATNAAIAFQGTGAATTLTNLKGVTAPSSTVATDLASYSGTTGQIQDSGILSASVATAGSPTVGHASCIKGAGPPVVIGYCSTVVASDGTCTCN